MASKCLGARSSCFPDEDLVIVGENQAPQTIKTLKSHPKVRVVPGV